MGILSQPGQQPPQRPPMGQRPPMPQGQRPPMPPQQGQQPQQPMQRPPQQGQQRPPMGQPQRPPMGQQTQRPPMGQQAQPMRPQQKPPQQKQGGNQEDFDKFVGDAIEILHNPKTSDMMVKKLSQAKSKVEEIGNMAIKILKGVELKAQKAGIQVNAKVAIQGLNIIVGEIITIAETAGMDKTADEQKYEAFSFALSRYLKAAFKEGKFTKEELVKVAQEMSQGKSGQAIIKNMGPEAAVLARGQQQAKPQNPQMQPKPQMKRPMPQGQPQGQPMPQGQPQGQPMQRPQQPQGILGQRRM